jgi:hypothetical protein
MSVIVAAIGAFLYRLRGGLIPTGSTTLARLLFAVPLGLFAAWMIGVPISPHGAITAAVLIAATMPGLLLGHGSYQDLKRMPDTFNELLDKVLPHLGLERGTYEYELMGLALKGIAVTLPLGIALSALGHRGAFYAICGFAMPAFYEIGWRIPSRIKGFEQGIELAEALFGAWLWLVLYVSLRSS